MIAPVTIAGILIMATLANQAFAFNFNSWQWQMRHWDNAILNIHNQQRANVNVQPLVWSDQLAASAWTWAQHLVTLNQGTHVDKAVLVHCAQTPGCNTQGEGENIALQWWPSVVCWGCPAFLISNLPTLTSHWINEKNNYNGQPIAAGAPYLHYTQMVWRTTTAVGCATRGANGSVSNGGSGSIVYLVCRYSPEQQWRQKPY
jgi:hypothetical protein